MNLAVPNNQHYIDQILEQRLADGNFCNRQHCYFKKLVSFIYSWTPLACSCSCRGSVDKSLDCKRSFQAYRFSNSISTRSNAEECKSKRRKREKLWFPLFSNSSRGRDGGGDGKPPNCNHTLEDNGPENWLSTNLLLIFPLMTQCRGLRTKEWYAVNKEDYFKLSKDYVCQTSDNTGMLLCYHSLNHDLWKYIRESLSMFFLPEGFPESVGESYLKYSFWRGIQNVISNITQVLSTQALLLAVGVGKSHSETLAAATVWAWKDGVGQLGRLFAAVFGNQYDADPKRWRLISDILYDIGLSLEIMSPAFPSYFLFIASLGNISKSVAFAIGISCRYSVLKTFVRRENLGEISAKNDAQNVVTGMLGTVVGVWVAKCLPTVPKIRLSMFLFFTAIYSFFNYKAMQVAELSTLNQQRGSILAHAYLLYNQVPNITSSNAYERFIPLVPQRFVHPKVRIGVCLNELSSSANEIIHCRRQFKKEKYMLSFHKGEIRVALHTQHQSSDLLQLLLHLAWIRDRVQRHLGKECVIHDINYSPKGHCKPTKKRLRMLLDEHFCNHVVFEGLQFAKKNKRHFQSLLQKKGFSTETILLAPEKCSLVW